MKQWLHESGIRERFEFTLCFANQRALWMRQDTSSEDAFDPSISCSLDWGNIALLTNWVATMSNH